MTRLNYINNVMKILDQINVSTIFPANTVLMLSELYIPCKKLIYCGTPLTNNLKMLIRFKNYYRKQYQKHRNNQYKTVCITGETQTL